MRFNTNIFAIIKAFVLTTSLLCVVHMHLPAKNDPVVDQYWANFLLDHPAYDQKALDVFFQGLSEFKPALNGERLGYAVSLVILWGERMDLPEEQAAVIRMTFYGEDRQTDIASTLGIPLGTVKSRVRLALARLRKAMEDNL